MSQTTEAPPAGVRPIWIQMKNYDMYALREEGAEATNMTALKPFVILDRTRLLEDVAKFGFMCDWNDYKVRESHHASISVHRTNTPPEIVCPSLQEPDPAHSNDGRRHRCTNTSLIFGSTNRAIARKLCLHSTSPSLLRCLQHLHGNLERERESCSSHVYCYGSQSTVAGSGQVNRHPLELVGTTSRLTSKGAKQMKSYWFGILTKNTASNGSSLTQQKPSKPKRR